MGDMELMQKREAGREILKGVPILEKQIQEQARIRERIAGTVASGVDFSVKALQRRDAIPRDSEFARLVAYM